MVNNTQITPTVNQYITDCWSQHVGQGAGWVSSDIPTDSVDRQSINLNNMSTNTQPTLGRHIDRVLAQLVEHLCSVIKTET